MPIGNLSHVSHEETTDIAQDGNAKDWPEDAAGSGFGFVSMLFFRWSYSYMNGILLKGRRQFTDDDHLTQDDLFDIPSFMKADVLTGLFWRNFRHQDGTLMKGLWPLCAGVYIAAGFWEFVYMLARISLPLSLRELLIIIQRHPGENVTVEALPYVIVLFVAALTATISQNRTNFLSTQCGIIIRSTLTSAVFEHALMLTPAGRTFLTSGEVTNLVAVDTQKLFEVAQEGHNLWSCPILVIVVSALLWNILGPQLTLGVLVLLLFLPLVQMIVKRMLNLRRRRSKLTDLRIDLLTSTLQGIRLMKLNHYEGKIEERLASVREQEMQLLRKELFMWGLVLTAAVTSPLLAFGAGLSFYALTKSGALLGPANAFSALLLFSILRFPINMTARLVGKTAQAADAARRISQFLSREVRSLHETNESRHSLDKQGEALLALKNGSFRVKPEDDTILTSKDSIRDNEEHTIDSPSENMEFVLRSVDLNLDRSEVVAVVGRIGCGKTTLLRAILGDLAPLPCTQLHVRGRLGYAAQQPFILSTSFRENILFGSKFSQERFGAVVEACALTEDILRLGPAGDLTQIGERGVTLSGGQKQRVALARVIYAEPDIALLDDCFSALDASTSSMVFEALFDATKGLLRRSATLLVTHAAHFLPRVDKILVLSEGNVSFLGTWTQLQKMESATSDIIDSLQESRHRETQRPTKDKDNQDMEKPGFELAGEDGIIMTVEEREFGIASPRVWVRWFSNAGGWAFFLSQLLFLALDRGFYVASDWWISVWSSATDEPVTKFGIYFRPQIDGATAQAKFVLVYAVIITLSVLATFVRSIWGVTGGARCAAKMFRLMTVRVFRAPMSYFDTTPLGRILNRFTYDVEVLDIELSVSMNGLMISSSWLVSSIIVMVTVLPWILLGLVPIGTIYFFIQRYYRMSGPDLQRIDALSRSPLQAKLAEGLEGTTTIRAFRKEKEFISSFRRDVDSNSSAMLNFQAAQRWLGIRIELLGNLITFAAALIVVIANGRLNISAGLVGLLIQWAVVFSTALGFFFQRLTECEARITSIERIHETTELPQEAAWETAPTITLAPSWPAKGELVFENVCMRYRESLPLALDHVSFHLRSGTRCGIVGRTGSGKTSITASLFRLVELESGRILLDDVELGRIGLADVRGRTNGLRMIPQDPVLFAGTLRDCLDPFHVETDDKVFEALQAVNYKGVFERGKDILEDPVSEGGSNFSVGERQLLCLARALVEYPRVMVLDEATASVDSATDTFIQVMLRSRFQGTTLLTIAHRLHTIMDYDVCLVMDQGRVAEFGSPHDLLQNNEGYLNGLVEATGPESAAELRRIAQEAAMARPKT